ncbi:hypothetical protein [Catellatospora sp. NPDC049133]|uniref:hypothetical protein n=1 Tax=Catellatospora sp. NPDC049133 TaxID=3155499 RepID=UPI0033F2C899
MRITLGFTHSDRASGYSSFTDGYRPGAQQDQVAIDVDDLDLGYLGEIEILDLVFEASNVPVNQLRGAALAVGQALADAVRTQKLRSLSTGDTVTIGAGGVRYACEGGAAWRLLPEHAHS